MMILPNCTTNLIESNNYCKLLNMNKLQELLETKIKALYYLHQLNELNYNSVGGGIMKVSFLTFSVMHPAYFSGH